MQVLLFLFTSCTVELGISIVKRLRNDQKLLCCLVLKLSECVQCVSQRSMRVVRVSHASRASQAALSLCQDPNSVTQSYRHIFGVAHSLWKMSFACRNGKLCYFNIAMQSQITHCYDIKMIEPKLTKVKHSFFISTANCQTLWQ